jgi:carboxypeptidase family protein
MRAMRGAALLLTIAAACGQAPPAAPRGPAAGGIAGIVRELETGEPVSFVTVTVHGPGRGDTATDGGGGFQVPALRPGRYQVTARWGGSSARVDRVLVVGGRLTRVDLRLALAPASHPAAPLGPGVPVQLRPDAPPVPIAGALGGIRGRVRDPVTSESLGGAVIAASTPGMRDAVLSMADDAGRFRMPALPPGVYTLSAYYQVVGRGSIEVRRSNVRVDAGKITVIDLDLDAQPEP